MLKCDFGNLEREISALEAAGARSLHWDVMDGHFVPNLSYGAMVIQRVRPRTNLLFDAHLMIANPERYVPEYINAGCDWITFHLEASQEPVPLLRTIRSAGCLAGVAISPDTPVEALGPCMGACDLVLVMSVYPGFGGQSFLPGSTDKVKAVRELFSPDTLVSIDGGIGPKTISQVAAAGTDVFVAGSSIFDQACYETAIREMEGLAQAARN
jgi:ribulose-phosphate 3-epimerase